MEEKTNMSTKVSMNYRLDDNTQTVGELWESIAKLAAGSVADNKVCDNYPFRIRQSQLESLKELVKSLDDSHNAIDTSLWVRKVLRGE